MSTKNNLGLRVIVELKFNRTPYFLSRSGEFIGRYSDDNLFVQWRLQNSQIEIWSDDERRNLIRITPDFAAIQLTPIPSRDEFIRRVVAWLDAIGSQFRVRRFNSVLIKFITVVDLSNGDSESRRASSVTAFAPSLSERYGAPTDYLSSLNFKDERGDVNIQFGPVEHKWLQERFGESNLNIPASRPCMLLFALDREDDSLGPIDERAVVQLLRGQFDDFRSITDRVRDDLNS